MAESRFLNNLRGEESRLSEKGSRWKIGFSLTLLLIISFIMILQREYFWRFQSINESRAIIEFNQTWFSKLDLKLYLSLAVPLIVLATVTVARLLLRADEFFTVLLWHTVRVGLFQARKRDRTDRAPGELRIFHQIVLDLLQMRFSLQMHRHCLRPKSFQMIRELLKSTCRTSLYFELFLDCLQN